MYYFYILQNDKKSLYYGYTNDLKRRFKEHIQGLTKTTKKGKWRLTYYEAYFSKEDAQEREKQIKQYGQALAQLKRRIKKSISKC